MGPLAGRHAVVTGGGRGIGAAIAAALSAAGARVTLLGRDRARLADTAARLGPAVATAAADVADPAAVDSAFEVARRAHGPVTVLVNNAGIAPTAPFARSDEALWSQVLAVNLLGTVRATRAALPDMLEGGFGRVVNVASTAGLKGYAYCTAYCAAKHAVVGLTRALAAELARGPVTVNAVCPGFTDTDMVAGAVEAIRAKTGRTAGEALASIVATNPQGRLVTPDEVADAVLWLCGAGAASVTGQSIAIAGGEVG